MLKAAQIRRFHRRLSVFVGLQILLWTISGIYFAWTDLDEIHGDHLRAPEQGVPFGPGWVAPTGIDFVASGRAMPESIDELAVVRVGDSVYYRLRATGGEVFLADARTGRIRDELSREEALALAHASFAPDVALKSEEHLAAAGLGPHHEYRGGALPAWRFEFDHPSRTRVYVATRDGVVTKHRNQQWRVFDFLWMLHTMDYRGRDDFNNTLLRGVALLALVTAVSGFLLWGWTSPRIRRRGRSRA